MTQAALKPQKHHDVNAQDDSVLKSGAQWAISTAREHLSFQKADFRASHWKSRQTLTQAAKTMGLKL